MARVDDVVRLIGHENRGDGKHERTLGAQPLLAVGDGTGGIPAVGRGCPLDIRVVECDLGEDEVAREDVTIGVDEEFERGERAAPRCVGGGNSDRVPATSKNLRAATTEGASAGWVAMCPWCEAPCAHHATPP